MTSMKSEIPLPVSYHNKHSKFSTLLQASTTGPIMQMFLNVMA